MAELNQKMQLLKRGDNSALIDIYELTKKSVFAIAFTILRDYCTAQDVMQDTYLKVQTSANQYADGTNARAWINTISRNLALNVYKKRKKECLVDFEEKDCFGESKEMLARDETGIIAMTLKVLDKNESDIVLMHTIGEIKLVEIAKMMNKSSATVRWQYNNALNKLRKFVEEQQ